MRNRTWVGSAGRHAVSPPPAGAVGRSHPSSPSRPTHHRWPAIALGTLGAACLPALAQDAAVRAYSVVPTLEVTASSTDTKRPAGESGSDFITELRPGVSVVSRSRRLRGTLNYALSAIHHSRDTSAAELQNQLSAALTAEAIDNFAFVDASANVSQRSLSAFGQQSVSGSQQDNNNRQEVGTVSVSPYVRGLVGDIARYEVRLSETATNTRRSKTGDSTAGTASASLGSAATGSLFGWGVQAARQRSSFRLGRTTETSSATASVTVRPDPELLLSVRGGREWSDVLAADSRATTTTGAALTWSPNERTLANVDVAKRYFGESYNVNFQHRLPLSTFRFSSSRDASTSSNPNGVGQPVTLYQLYDSVLLSRYPDPVERDQQVRALIAVLGRDPESVVIGGFVTSSVTLQRRTDLGWTYTGVRLTVGVQAFSSNTSVLNDSGVDDPNAISQHGYTVSAGYRLTPTASASLTGARLITPSNGVQQGTDLKSLSLAWTDRLTRTASASISARYSVFNSSTDPYRETAVTASLSLRF